MLGVASRLRELKVPVDGIIQDWQYWPPGNDTWGSHLFDPARYPDPVAMFKQLHDEHYHALISVWAKFDLGSDNSKELNAVGGMFPKIQRYAFASRPGPMVRSIRRRGPADLLEANARPTIRQRRRRLVAGRPGTGNQQHGFPQLHHPDGAGLYGLQRLSADALDGHLPGAAGHHR